MMNAANQAVETFSDAIDMVEYKFIYKENIARCVKMGVPNLPSMYINGKLTYRSIIPTKEALKIDDIVKKQLMNAEKTHKRVGGASMASSSLNLNTFLNRNF